LPDGHEYQEKKYGPTCSKPIKSIIFLEKIVSIFKSHQYI